MKKRTRRILLAIAIEPFLIVAAIAGVACIQLYTPRFHPPKDTYIYIDSDDTVDSVYYKVKSAGKLEHILAFRLLMNYRHYADHIHTGCYLIRPGDNIYRVSSRLYRAHQHPVNLTIGSVRTLDKLARNVSRQLMIDSTQVAAVLTDSMLSLFIPNTYQVYWNMSAESFIDRMKREHTRFWTADRRAKARALDMTPDEVATLASIVEEETNDAAEKSVVAGLYINRLKRGMMLQADPTVKYALQNFELRRITNEQLKTPSPYNTYLHAGLPPTPIRIPTPAGIDAVLNYAHHNYLYMCAKEDFSGTHNFATNLADHNRNANRYRAALNKRRIYQ
ncbi:MAG: endolytic transglycosylase MltG [Prevotellaceae bacterium]|jgi:UPF0755 protein|nr:endolytic transglycosylase MltG [Prevotellaceae bacterium]